MPARENEGESYEESLLSPSLWNTSNKAVKRMRDDVLESVKPGVPEVQVMEMLVQK